MNTWWAEQNTDEVYLICTEDWSPEGFTLPYSAPVDDYYWDFGNGFVPFFGVIGAYNIVMYGDNVYSEAQAMVPDAVASFAGIGIPTILPNMEMSYNDSTSVDLTDLFYYEGEQVDAIITVASMDPAIVEATVEGTTLTLKTFENFGNIQIILTGAYDGVTGETSFDVLIIPPDIEALQMAVQNSADQAAYPNNPNPYANTLTDLGWTEIVQVTEGLLVSLSIDFSWTSFDYASEGSFWLGTPWGESLEVYSPTEVITDTLSIELFDFAGEPMAGTWTLWLEDSYADGGHQVTDCVVTFKYSASSDGNNFEVPVMNKLIGNYPNPFNPTTSIKFATIESGHVTLEIFNSKGQKVKTLLNETMSADSHTIDWNGTDGSGKAVSSGIYFYKMRTNSYNETKKMVLMK